ncbi:hypothetical protein BKA57DRAFT_456709 [Linnemannia elongata]|nr:hypothetical protein BKA57DRAFT_456709 [Linnemannia elongata]
MKKKERGVLSFFFIAAHSFCVFSLSLFVCTFEDAKFSIRVGSNALIWDVVCLFVFVFVCENSNREDVKVFFHYHSSFAQKRE